MLDGLGPDGDEHVLPRARSASHTPPLVGTPPTHSIGSPRPGSFRCGSPVPRDASGRSVFSRPRSFWNKKPVDAEQSATTAERTPLMRAAEEGDLSSIEELLSSGADVNEANSAGVSALVYAARAEQWAAVRLLISRGAEVDACSKTYRKTPLIWAAKAGELDTIRFLMDRGASVTHRDVDHMTATLVAADAGHWDAVYALVDRGADVNVKPSQDKKTLLMMAALQGSADAIRALYLRGAKVDITQVDGITPLMYASYNGDAESVRALIEAGANVNSKDRNGTTVLFWAISHGATEEIVRLLLERGSDPNEKAEMVQLAPICMAAKENRFDLVKVIAESNADLSAKDEDGCTPLMLAAAAGAFEAVRALLDAGASFEETDDLEQGPLHHACQPCPGLPVSGEAVRMLLEAGADPDAEDERQSRPLHFAAAIGSESAVKLLLEAGADVDAQDGEGRTPLFYACKLKHLPTAAAVAKLLLDKGADADVADSAGKAPLAIAAKRNNARLVRLLHEAGADLEAKDWRSDTALLIAARHEKWDAMRELAACGADVNAAEQRTCVAPHTPGTPSPSPADESLLARIGSLPRRQQRDLLKRGYSFSLPDRSQGRTALMYCAEHGDASTVRLLLRRGADPKTATGQGWTAIEYCKRGRRDRLERAMSAHAEAALQHVRPAAPHAPPLHRIPSSGAASAASFAGVDSLSGLEHAPSGGPRHGPKPAPVLDPAPGSPGPLRPPPKSPAGLGSPKAGQPALSPSRPSPKRGSPVPLARSGSGQLPSPHRNSPVPLARTGSGLASTLAQDAAHASRPPPPSGSPPSSESSGSAAFPSFVALPPPAAALAGAPSPSLLTAALQGLAGGKISPVSPSITRSRRDSMRGSRASSASPPHRARRVPSLSDIRALLFPTLINTQLDAKPAGPVAARRRSLAFMEHAASPRGHELEPPAALSHAGRASRRRSMAGGDPIDPSAAPPDDAEAAAIMDALQKALEGQTLAPSTDVSEDEAGEDEAGEDEDDD